MGISFHITSVREGTIFNVLQFLSLERVTGVLKIAFGHQLPEVIIYFVTGNITTAEFGAIVGDAVLDVLLCQEYAVKEVNFSPGRLAQFNEKAIILKAASLSAVMLQVSKDVDKCETRAYIYGMMPLIRKDTGDSEPLLNMMYEFPKWDDFLSAVPAQDNDKKAPLPPCALIHRALARNVLSYGTPLVSLRMLRTLLDILQPLSEKESNNLRAYMRSLLPHPKATHMSIDRFYAFASAIESMAQRRSSEVGDVARRAIHQLIQKTTKAADA